MPGTGLTEQHNYARDRYVDPRTSYSCGSLRVFEKGIDLQVYTVVNPIPFTEIKVLELMLKEARELNAEEKIEGRTSFITSHEEKLAELRKGLDELSGYSGLVLGVNYTNPNEDELKDYQYDLDGFIELSTIERIEVLE